MLCESQSSSTCSWVGVACCDQTIAGAICCNRRVQTIVACCGEDSVLERHRCSVLAGPQSSGGGPRRASLEADVQLNKWGFVPGGDDTLELNLMTKGARRRRMMSLKQAARTAPARGRLRSCFMNHMCTQQRNARAAAAKLSHLLARLHTWWLRAAAGPRASQRLPDMFTASPTEYRVF